MGRCDDPGEKRALGGASLDRKCDRHQGGLKGIKNECKLMERCVGHGEGVLGWGGVMVMERSKRALGVSLGWRKCDTH